MMLLCCRTRLPALLASFCFKDEVARGSEFGISHWKIMVQVPWPVRNRTQTLELVIATDCKAASIDLVFVVAAYQCSFLLKLSSKFLDVTHLGQAKMRVLVTTMLVISFSKHPDIDNAVISACLPRLFPWRHHELVDGCARDCLQTRDRTKKVSLKFSKGYAVATPI